MNFKILYHPKVVREDIPKLPAIWKTKIQLAIESRLISEPGVFGKPLRKSLKGYRKLRVGDYRVIFLLENKIVKILAIMHRSIIYEKINKRV
jgi:mRNA interferase RelE/StbE